MPELPLEDALELLDELELTLDDMYRLAELAARDDCGDAERAELQREMEVLQQRIDRLADSVGGAS